MTDTSLNTKKIMTYDIHSGYVDPTPVCDPSTTEFEDFLVGAGNPPIIDVIDVSTVKIKDISWVHNNPISAKIDLEMVADQLSNDEIWPDMKVSVSDLSTGMYYIPFEGESANK